MPTTPDKAEAIQRFKDGMSRATDLLPPGERDELYRDLAQIARTHRQQSAIGAQPRAVCNHTEDGQPYCAQPECDVDWCQDCGDEYSEPCARHENAGRP